MKKKFLIGVILFITGVILMHLHILLEQLYKSLFYAINNEDSPFYFYYLLNVLVIVFMGCLIEYQRLWKAFKSTKITLLLLPALTLILLACIPNTTWGMLFGVSRNQGVLGWLIEPLKYETSYIWLGLIGGILLARSFQKKRAE